MNKAELIEKLAQETGLSGKQAEDFLRAFEHVVISTLQSGGEVSITGFGTFSARLRDARMGVNPQSPGEKIRIPAVTVPKFKAGKTLKDSLKNTGGAAPTSSPPSDELPESPAAPEHAGM